ncbi:hypothetical protein XAP3CFBP6996_000265 [Xanthomonas citri pv. fuscans CFBP 6996]|nr:hypothetical protein XAP3CFBP6996_000265 [Xanthomonas citri pv. fuscans CFBP 6996]QWN14508.1 hypothetical protein DGN02_00270 [Xanthomonas citri]
MRGDMRAKRCAPLPNEACAARPHNARNAGIVSHPGGTFRLICELSYATRFTGRPPRFRGHHAYRSSATFCRAHCCGGITNAH